MSENRDVRDPIHGFIHLEGKEGDVVGTPVFQRLRGIRQLALASLVYPGAVHTRFDHTLGVLAVANLMADSKPFQFSNEDKELVRFAALLHDLGHGPFSHVSEGALELFADRAKLSGRLKNGNPAKIHELITQDLLESDKDLRHILGGSNLTKIQKLLQSGYGEPVLKSVISGPLDADKQDYLLRDTYFCGVKYGVFDLHQLHRQLDVVVDPEQGGKQLAITSRGVHALEQYVLAKYYLTTQVYRHRIRLITDEMIVRAISLGIEADEITEMRELYSYDGSEKFLENYLQWDDARFLLMFGSCRGTYCAELIDNLRRRRLLKKVFEQRVSKLSLSYRDQIDSITKTSNRKLRRALEQHLAGAIESAGVRLCCSSGDASNFVVAYAYSFKSVRTQSRNDEGPIPVKGSRGITTFEEDSELFNSINEKLVDPRFAVFAPVAWENPTERRKVTVKLEKPILDCLETFKWQVN